MQTAIDQRRTRAGTNPGRLLTLLVCLCFGIVPAALAQSELAVAPGVGTLNDAIENDTNRPADRVYVLQRGAYYGLPRELNNETFVLRIKAADGEGERPVLYPAPDNTGQVPGSRYIRLVEDAYFDGVYLLAVDPSGGQKGIPIAVNGEGQRLVIDNSVMESGLARFWEINAADTKIYVRNSQFRNMFRTDNSSNGRAFDYRTVSGDTLYIENTSFLNISGYLVRYDGPALKHFYFNHNTVHTTGRELFTNALATQAIEYVFTNNLVVNPYAMGQAPPEDGTAPIPGVLRVDSLDADIDNGFTEADRRIVFTHNNIAHSQAVQDFYAARTAAGDPRIAYALVHPPSQAYIDSTAGAVARDNIADPVVFTNPPSMADWVAWAGAFRDGASELPAVAFGAEEGLFPAEQPLPEDLSYATTDVAYTAGTGGFPLGDLNWFPARKADWLAAGGGSGSPVAAEQAAAVPDAFQLRGNYPNPFNPATTILFDLAAAAQVQVEVFDLLGRRVLALPTQAFAAGAGQRVAIDASALSSGLYLYRVTARSATAHQVRTGTMTLLK